MKADLRAVKTIERTMTCPTKMIRVADFVRALQRGVFYGKNFTKNLEAYISPGFGVGSTKFTEAMVNVKENIPAKFQMADFWRIFKLSRIVSEECKPCRRGRPFRGHGPQIGKRSKYSVLIKHPYLWNGQSFLHAVKTVQLSSASGTNWCWYRDFLWTPKRGVFWGENLPNYWGALTLPNEGRSVGT